MSRTTYSVLAGGAIAAVAVLAWIAARGGSDSAPLAFGGAVVALLPERERVRIALRRAAIERGINPDFLDVLGYHESRWRLGAVNQAGNDGKRGGAWGPTQITERTARGYGYTGAMEALTLDPDLAAGLTAAMLSDGCDCGSIETIAAYWNAGRKPTDPRLPDSTRRYIDAIAKELDNLPAAPEE